MLLLRRERRRDGPVAIVEVGHDQRVRLPPRPTHGELDSNRAAEADRAQMPRHTQRRQLHRDQPACHRSTCALVSRCATIQRVTGTEPRTARRLASSRGLPPSGTKPSPIPIVSVTRPASPHTSTDESAPARHRWECQQRKEGTSAMPLAGPLKYWESLEAGGAKGEGVPGLRCSRRAPRWSATSERASAAVGVPASCAPSRGAAGLGNPSRAGSVTIKPLPLAVPL